MSDQTLSLAETLRSVMATKGMKLTQLAEMTGVPYRSLQNYFSRKTEMPAGVYLKIAAALGMDPHYPAREKFALNNAALTDALIKSLGRLLPTVHFSEDGSMGLCAHAEGERDPARLRRDASSVALFVANAYDLILEAAMRQPFDADD